MDNKKNYAVMDGNTAAAYSAYAFTEVAAIYPITPSSPMAEKVDEWSAKGKKNLFGTTVDVIQMQSEAGAAGTCHGSLQAGALTTTFTSSQGLMLMIPAMYAMGGQSSKATPTSATAKFAASGKKVAKKDLGAILMQYEYVYVAQVAMGADQAQTLKALREAESYDGPSIVICYCPCLEQHIKAGMGTSQDEMKKAVECGYWHLYRYDPRRIAEGKNPFQLDSKEPDTDKVMDFLMGENRFASLKNNFPDKAEALYAKEVEDVKARYARYKKLAED